MWFAPLKAFLKTSFWRFMLAFSVVVFLVCFGIVIMVYQFTVVEYRKQLKEQLILAAQGFEILSKTEGLTTSEFSHAVQSRITNSQSLVLSFQSFEAAEQFGNLDRIPQSLATFPQISSFVIAIDNIQGDPEPQRVLGTQLHIPQGVLVIGVFNAYQKELEDRFFLIAALMVLGALLITLISGVLFNRQILSRVQNIVAFSKRIQSGDMDERLPISARGDEYDVISKQINHMLDEIKGHIESISGVTDNIAHDLRTPLSQIRIQMEEALKQVPIESEQGEWYNQLLLRLDQVIGTFNAMLELSRLEQGIISKKENCDLSKVCHDVYELLTPVAQQKLSFDLVVKSTAVIAGEPNLIFRAIYNLVENAIQYTPEKGSVKLIVDARRIVVEDNGPGIPNSEKEKVFQRLYRLDTSRSSAGYGLGLAITKAIVEGHQGGVHLEDNFPGLRATIQF